MISHHKDQIPKTRAEKESLDPIIWDNIYVGERVLKGKGGRKV